MSTGALRQALRKGRGPRRKTQLMPQKGKEFMSPALGSGCGSVSSLFLYPCCYVSHLRLRLLGTNFFKSNKYTNVPGLRVLEFDQNFNARGKGDLLFQYVMNCCIS